MNRNKSRLHGDSKFSQRAELEPTNHELAALLCNLQSWKFVTLEENETLEPEKALTVTVANLINREGASAIKHESPPYTILHYYNTRPQYILGISTLVRVPNPHYKVHKLHACMHTILVAITVRIIFFIFLLLLLMFP